MPLICLGRIGLAGGAGSHGKEETVALYFDGEVHHGKGCHHRCVDRRIAGSL